jgi:hypothetical protein
LSVGARLKRTSMAIVLVMSAILLVAYNDALGFIVIVAKRLEICPKRSNFD